MTMSICNRINMYFLYFIPYLVNSESTTHEGAPESTPPSTPSKALFENVPMIYIET